MVKLEFIKVYGENLEGKPLFFRKIFYNELTDFEEEKKMFSYDSSCQTDMMRKMYTNREISKTIVKYQETKEITK
jgi:hypothetical protein